jgi:glyoxylate reductase
MTSSKAKVIVTRRLPGPVEARMAELFDAELNPSDDAFDRERLVDAMGRCDILVPTLTDRIDEAMIAGAGERLRLIANFGAGTDNIDLAAARDRGIAVTNTPDALTDDTADIVIALILMALRRLGEGERVVRDGRWAGWGPTDQLGRTLRGKTLAIVGMGRIGQAVARRARAFGMRIDYHNRRPVDPATEAALEARYCPDLDSMIAEADVLSLNAPYSPETRQLIDRRRLGLMRPEAWLINAARGAMLDEEALIEALEAGRIAGAGLDVYPREPHVEERLKRLDNVVLLPHLGSATIETRTAMGEMVIANILAVLDGVEPPNRVA